MGLRLLLLLAAALLSACSDQPEVYRFSGAAMGTGWNVTVVAPPQGVEQAYLQTGVTAAIDEVNSLMSNWREDSEVSRFNAAPPLEWFPLSASTHDVLVAAQVIYRKSGGAFDVTVSPLIELWGFGAREVDDAMPTDEQIGAALEQVGGDMLSLKAGPPGVRKGKPREINLSAIAKGYGVDHAAEWLEAQGVTRYMVEIGGEVRTSGLSPRDDGWRIGIEAPELLRGDAVKALSLRGESVATSGDYRNYREVNGVRYSHTIDPVTGRPITHNLASVSVVADNCMYADGWATAIDVMGPERGMELAEREGLAVYMLVRNADGSFEARSSTAFAPYLK